ncbi:MAG: NUDIX hydrolase [Solirubrobacteraceae bacterium]
MQALSTVSFSSTLGAVAWLVAGALVGVFLGHLLSPRLNAGRTRRAAGRARRRRRLFDYAGRPLELHGIDVGLQVLYGTLGQITRPRDVRATLLERRWRAAPELREGAELYARKHGFYDGDVARLNDLDVETYADAEGDEHHRVWLRVAPTGYFDMLATNVALGPFTPETAPLLTGRGGIPETQLSNMMGLDLTLVTSDGDVPVFLRSAKMAALERCWQTSSGETVQLARDKDIDGAPDIFKTARRGLEEELGIPPEAIEELALTAFVATPEFANIGVLMYAVLRQSTTEFASELNRYVMTARDNWEYEDHAMLLIDDARELARALTDPRRRWSKQAAASLIFAHAYRAGNVESFVEAVRALGPLSLEPGSVHRGIPPRDDEAAQPARHCWRCGSVLGQIPPTRCAVCGQEHFTNPKPCGEAVVVHEGHVLLVRRARSPWKGKWDVPGGFCEGDEHPMHAAERELAEEVGLRASAVSYLGTWIDVYGPATFDGLHEHTANSAYLMQMVGEPAGMRHGLADVSAESLQLDEVTAARWFSLDEIPEEIAFPNHVCKVLALTRQVVARSGCDQQLLPDRNW